MKVIIITEGSKEIGFGHITRCMSLYQAFDEKKIPVQFIVNGDSSIESMLINTRYKIFDWLKHPDELFKLLYESDIAIIDSYLAHEDFYNKISGSIAIPIYIDDNKRINYPEGVVINGSILADQLNYPSKKVVKYLLGSQYMPLRKEFWHVPKKEINNTIQSIMITFGGDDLRNMTLPILKMFIDKYPDFVKNVVVGKGFKNKTEIRKLEDDKTEIIFNPDANGMLNLMLESDIAISAGGQTLYELGRVGIPTIAIIVADNQIHNIKAWQDVGFIEVAGFWNNDDLLNIIEKKLYLLNDREIRLTRCKNGEKYMDGFGANRIAKYALNKFYREKIKIRPVENEDIYNIYELSNEYEVRKNSFYPEKIEFNVHEKWFKKRMKDKNCVFLVGEINGEFAGQIRFDLSESKAIISISISKKYRDLGLGKHILKNSIDYLKRTSPSIKIVKANIKETNRRSVKFFEKSNFVYGKKKSMENEKTLEYIYKLRD